MWTEDKAAPGPGHLTWTVVNGTHPWHHPRHSPWKVHDKFLPSVSDMDIQWRDLLKLLLSSVNTVAILSREETIVQFHWIIGFHDSAAASWLQHLNFKITLQQVDWARMVVHAKWPPCWLEQSVYTNCLMSALATALARQQQCTLSINPTAAAVDNGNIFPSSKVVCLSCHWNWILINWHQGPLNLMSYERF